MQQESLPLAFKARKTHCCAMGRPKLKNNVSLNLTLDVSEKHILRQLAAARRESISQLVGRLAREQCERETRLREQPAPYRTQ